MKWVRNKEYRIRAALAAGLAAVMIVWMIPEKTLTMWTTPRESVQVCGWWGTMYPKFCFAKGRAEEDGERGKVKISFWLAKAFDW